MANTFLLVRWCAYAWCIICAISVLGLSAGLAVHFIDVWADRPYIIYALVCSSLTISGLTLLSLRSQPRLDVLAIAVLCVLWLALGAYSADIISYVQCETLAGQHKIGNNGHECKSELPGVELGLLIGAFLDSSIAWCREMKAIMAFSFATFGILLVCLLILLALIIALHARGHQDFWAASMSDVPWFGQFDPSFGPQGGVVYGNGGVPPMVATPNYSGNVVYQQPGHNVIIENGQVRQVPTGVPGY